MKISIVVVPTLLAIISPLLNVYAILLLVLMNEDNSFSSYSILFSSNIVLTLVPSWVRIVYFNVSKLFFA